MIRSGAYHGIKETSTMTEMLSQSQSKGTDVVAESGIPGISAAELDVMQAAAARFLDGRATGHARSVTCAEDLQLLAEPADSLAEGAVSPHRDLYRKHHGSHFMYMQYYPS